jgi:death on curing protein
VIYLTAPQLLFIHARLLAETGGSGGIRDLGLLQAAIARPQATFDGQELYPTLYARAAALLHSLVSNHPFVDGNKRVGITAAGLFLRLNGHSLQVTNHALEQFVLQVAQGQLSVEEITMWLEGHSRAQP